MMMVSHGWQLAHYIYKGYMWCVVHVGVRVGREVVRSPWQWLVRPTWSYYGQMWLGPLDTKKIVFRAAFFRVMHWTSDVAALAVKGDSSVHLVRISDMWGVLVHVVACVWASRLGQVPRYSTLVGHGHCWTVQLQHPVAVSGKHQSLFWCSTQARPLCVNLALFPQHDNQPDMFYCCQDVLVAAAHDGYFTCGGSWHWLVSWSHSVLLLDCHQHCWQWDKLLHSIICHHQRSSILLYFW